jgi:hypothetical protein
MCHVPCARPIAISITQQQPNNTQSCFLLLSRLGEGVFVPFLPLWISLDNLISTEHLNFSKEKKNTCKCATARNLTGVVQHHHSTQRHDL